MFDNFLRRSTNHKKRVNKKRNFEIDSPASSGGEEKYMKYVSFSYPPIESTLSILDLGLVFVKTLFDKEIIHKEISLSVKSQTF